MIVRIKREVIEDEPGDQPSLPPVVLDVSRTIPSCHLGEFNILRPRPRPSEIKQAFSGYPDGGIYVF